MKLKINNFFLSNIQLFAVSILVMSSCHSRQSNVFMCQDAVPAKLFSVADSASIDITDLQYDFRFTSSYYDDSISLFLGLDNSRNSIDIFDLENKRYVKSITFNKEGIKPINVTDFFIHTPDSLFLLDENAYKLGLIDLNGEWRYLEHLDIGEDAGYIESDIESQLFYNPISKHLLLPVTFGISKKDPDYRNTPFLAVFDLIFKKRVGASGKYPPGYYTTQPYTPSNDRNYSILRAVSTSIIVMHFEHAPYLMEFDYLKDSIVSMACAKSAYVPNYLPEFEGSSDNYLDLQEYFTTTPGYFHGFYHKKFQKYVIPVKHSQSLDRHEMRNTPFTSNWSLLIVNNNLQVIGEQLFEQGRANYLMVYPARGGIAIAGENPADPENNEDILSFKYYAFY